MIHKKILVALMNVYHTDWLEKFRFGPQENDSFLVWTLASFIWWRQLAVVGLMMTGIVLVWTLNLGNWGYFLGLFIGAEIVKFSPKSNLEKNY